MRSEITARNNQILGMRLEKDCGKIRCWERATLDHIYKRSAQTSTPSISYKAATHKLVITDANPIMVISSQTL
jgi:hypothetical protein